MPLTIVTAGAIARGEADTSATSFQSKNTFATASIATGNVFLGITAAGWWKFTGHGIPKNAEILSATLDLTASIARGGVSTHQIEALDNVGRDWIPDATTKWNRPLWGTFKANIRDTSSTTIINTVPGAVSAFWAMKDNITPGRRQRLAVVFTPTANATLGEVLMHVRRSGTGSSSGTGSVFLEIHGTDANGNPDETVLATSSVLTAASMPFPQADVTFPFTGADQIPLLAGVTYAVVFNATDPAHATNNVQWMTLQQFFSVAGSRMYGTGRDFDDQHYPDQGAVVVGAPSLAGVVPWTFLATVAGTTYTSPDISALISAIIAQPEYAAGDPIGLRLAPLTGGGAPPRRDWAAFEHATFPEAVLNVTYQITRDGVQVRGADLGAVTAAGADLAPHLARGAEVDTVSAAGAGLGVVKARGADLSAVKAAGDSVDG